jgi:hypothetical protein
MPQWRTIAPIWDDYPDANDCLSSSFDFGEGVSIGPFTRAELTDDDTIHLSFDHRELVRRARFSFLAEYEAVENEADPAWEGTVRRTKQESAMLRIRLANIALWLARPTSIGIEELIHQFELGGRFVRGVSQPGPWWPLSARPHYAGDSLMRGDLERAKELFDAIRQLERNGSVWVAVFMLFKGLCDNEWAIRFPLLWIALEAIFGVERGRRITHRLAKRVALFLESGERAGRLYQQTKGDYEWRSKMMHGAKVLGRDDAEAEAVLIRTEETVRATLNKILGDDRLTEILNGSDRDRYLGELALAGC